MALFWQRTKNQITAPAQYIQTTDKVSRPMAVMSALVMFFVVIAIIVGLIFAGIWGYNKITGNNSKPANPITGISTGESTDSKPNSTTQGSSSTATNGSTSTNTTSGQAATNNSSASSSASTQAANTTSTSAVPNTGAGSTIAVFIVSTIIGTLLYRVVLIRRLQ